MSTVVPIPKSDNHSSPTNYRPISLLSIVSKLLERHVHHVILDHLEEHFPLSNRQWGFTEGKGTITSLIATVHDWLCNLDQGNDICIIFFDYKKAFDSVPHGPLMEKLCSIGLNEHILRWIWNYLSSRLQQVAVNGSVSSTIPVRSGVPQGSVLGPLLFIIYVNDLTLLPLADGSNLSLFADDVILYRPISVLSDYFKIQCDITAIEHWSDSNFLSLNPQKCKYMIVSRKRSPLLPGNALQLYGQGLCEVSLYKYLGVLLSSDMKWSSHIEVACSKAKRMLGLLYRRFYGLADCKTIVQLYLSIVRPHLEYASSLWDPHTQKDISALENVQKFACKIATKHWNYEYQQLLETCAVPSLAGRRTKLKLCQLYNILYGHSYFPQDIFVYSSHHYSTRSHHMVLSRPLAHTNSFLYSFVPNSISLWNSLSAEQVSAPSLHAFKRLL